MKKRLYEICSSLSVLIAAVLWLISAYVEGFEFGVLGFLAVTLDLFAVVSIVFGFVEKRYPRIVFGGFALFLGLLATLSLFKVLNLAVGLSLALIVGALTSIFAVIVNKGRKWDAGDKD